jgi:chromosomal replication initiator protein
MQTVWNEFLNIIREEAGSRVVETWFKVINFDRWDAQDNVVYLVAPNSFVRNWVKKHYMSMMRLHLGRLLHVEGPRIEFRSLVDPSEQEATFTASTSTTLSATETPTKLTVIPASVVRTENNLVNLERRKIGNINKNYRFDNFIIGPSNSLAYAAAHAVTEQPGQRYNPLFIYGKSGLGKTHLMHAIGNEIKSRYKEAVVLYQTADRFVTEFISAIRFNKVHKFQAKYHAVDVLLIDDMQFISNKEHTQEAFFHIFNALYEAHKQIIFSSDVFPHDIKGIAERLRSRLSSGLVTDIREPSLETKIAILKKKASTNQEDLSDDVALFIAEQGFSNIRELEGALIRVMAFASLTKQPVSLDIAKKVLYRTPPPPTDKKLIDFSVIIRAISKHYTYTLDDLRAKDRSKEVAQVRHLAMYFMKKLTDKSLRDIGAFLGGRDHSTVMHGLQKIENQIEQDKQLEAAMRQIEQVILDSY